MDPATSHVGAWLTVVAVLATLTSAALAWRLWRGGARLRQRLHDARHELAELRDRDALTGVATREAFEAALAQATDHADRRGQPLWLAHIGIDGFRALNDSFGMRVGDAVLRELAQRLVGWVERQGGTGLVAGPGGKAAIPPTLRVARLGGDEFVLWCSADAQAQDGMAQSLLRLVGEPLQAEALNIQLGASIGLACYPDDAARPRLVAHAALAMRSVKHTGGNGHARFDPAMAQRQREHGELVSELRQALARGQLQLVYQD
jgi:diguanylate cyclase